MRLFCTRCLPLGLILLILAYRAIIETDDRDSQPQKLGQQLRRKGVRKHTMSVTADAAQERRNGKRG